MALPLASYEDRYQWRDDVMAADVVSIGAICGAAEVTCRTVRHYETEGIVKPARLTAGGRKLYSEDTVDIIRMVRVLQECGYSLR